MSPFQNKMLKWTGGDAVVWIDIFFCRNINFSKKKKNEKHMACHVIENDDRSFNSANDMKIWSL